MTHGMFTNHKWQPDLTVTTPDLKWKNAHAPVRMRSAPVRSVIVAQPKSGVLRHRVQMDRFVGVTARTHKHTQNTQEPACHNKLKHFSRWGVYNNSWFVVTGLVTSPYRYVGHAARVLAHSLTHSVFHAARSWGRWWFILVWGRAIITFVYRETQQPPQHSVAQAAPSSPLSQRGDVIGPGSQVAMCRLTDWLMETDKLHSNHMTSQVCQ